MSSAALVYSFKKNKIWLNDERKTWDIAFLSCLLIFRTSTYIFSAEDTLICIYIAQYVPCVSRASPYENSDWCARVPRQRHLEPGGLSDIFKPSSVQYLLYSVTTNLTVTILSNVWHFPSNFDTFLYRADGMKKRDDSCRLVRDAALSALTKSGFWTM